MRSCAYFSRLSFTIPVVLVCALLATMLNACVPGIVDKLSRQEAIDLLRSQVPEPDEIAWDIIGFSYPEPLQPGDTVMPAYNPDRLRETTSEEWFFWIDHNPFARYAHPTTFVFIDRNTAEITFFQDAWWPVINDVPHFTTDEEYWNVDDWAFSNIDEETVATYALASNQTDKLITIPRTIENRGYYNFLALGIDNGEDSHDLPFSPADNGNYAIVINGWKKGETLGGDFNLDAENMYDLFSNAGFRTIYFGPLEHNFTGRRDADIIEIGKQFGRLWNIMEPCHTLMVYITAHGNFVDTNKDNVPDTAYVMIGGQAVTSKQLKGWLEYFKECVHVHVIIDACYSGAMIDDLKEVTECVVTATNDQTTAQADLDLGIDPNPDDKGGEFTSGFAQGMREILNDKQATEQAEADAERTGRSFWQQVTTRAMKTAIDNLPNKPQPYWLIGAIALRDLFGVETNYYQHPQDWYMPLSDRAAKCCLISEGSGTVTPEPEEPQDQPQDEYPPEASISTTIKPIVEIIEDESGCDGVLTVNYESLDLTSGVYPLAYVELLIDGETWQESGSISTDHYQASTLKEVDCHGTYTIQVKTINEQPQTLISTRDFSVPSLSTHFEWGIIDVPESGESCQMQLFINYQAVDLGTPENPVTNVLVKANGVTWQNSGSISSLWYENSFSRLVDCGNMYTIEVIGTDSDGNKYTYRERIQIPVATPPDETPPPPPPQTTLYAALAASAQCTAYGYECSCQLSISFDGKDLTLGDYPVKQVILKVNGTEWYNSGTITETHHHNSVTRTVGCGQTFNMELTVKNTLGQTATSTGSITTPIP